MGDVLLTSEPGRLVLTTARPTGVRSLGPSLLQALAIGAALLAASLVLDEHLPGAVMMVGLGLLLLIIATRLEAREGRRRVVLHFASELLRLELLPRTGRPIHHDIPFDDVVSIDLVEEQGAGFGIRVWWKGPKGAERTELLVRRARPEEGAALHRVWRMLRNAVGLDGTELPD